MIKKLVSRVKDGALTAAGLGCLTAAAWTATLWAGLVALGASLLLLEWRLDK